MPPLLKVNGLDVSAFLRVQPDDGLDPVDSEFEQPQFGGSPALAEGGIFVADTTRNKQWTAPLWTNSTASGAQGVNHLIEQVNNSLRRGPAAVEFRPEGASQSTFFDLEKGRLDPQYSHFHHRRGWAKSTLHLWTKPFGHTATMRSVVPSQVWQGASGPVNVLATGLQGDVPALVNLYAHPSQAGMFMYGITPLPTFDPFIHATRFLSGNTSTLVANASVLGGFIREYAAFPNATSQQINVNMGPAEYCGRNRVFLLAGHTYSGSLAGGSAAVQMMLHDSTYDALNPQLLTLATQVIATQITGSLNMQLLDMGEVTVASQIPGAAPAPTTVLSITAHVTFPTQAATYALRLNGLIIVPLDHSAGIVASHSTADNNHALRSWPVREGWSSAFVATSMQGFGPTGFPHTDLLKLLRGDVPRMPKGATQARIMMFAHKAGGVIANPVYGMTVQVDALERFKFLR